MKNLESKEDVLELMIKNYNNLSSKDFRVFLNLVGKPIVSTKQDQLVDKLLSKYAKAIKRSGKDPDQLRRLPWKRTKVTETDPIYSLPKVSLVDEKLRIKLPYIKSSKKAVLSELQLFYNYDDRTKEYYGKFTTAKLKRCLKLFNLAGYPKVNLCPDIAGLIDEAEQYRGVYDPTLMKVNGNYLIAAHNEHLEKAISEISLNDDPLTLSKLIKYGITIHESVHLNDIHKRFASMALFYVDRSDIEKIYTQIVSLGVKKILVDDMYDVYDRLETIRKHMKNTRMTVEFDHMIEFLQPSEITKTTDVVLFIRYRKWISRGILSQKFFKIVMVKDDDDTIVI